MREVTKAIERKYQRNNLGVPIEACVVEALSPTERVVLLEWAGEASGTMRR